MLPSPILAACFARHSILTATSSLYSILPATFPQSSVSLLKFHGKLLSHKPTHPPHCFGFRHGCHSPPITHPTVSSCCYQMHSILALTFFLSSLTWGIAAKPANDYYNGKSMVIQAFNSQCTYSGVPRALQPGIHCTPHREGGINMASSNGFSFDVPSHDNDYPNHGYPYPSHGYPEHFFFKPYDCQNCCSISPLLGNRDARMAHPHPTATQGIEGKGHQHASISTLAFKPCL